MNQLLKIKMGLGEAIVRHNTLHKIITTGIASEEQRKEYALITEAMNDVMLDLGFDCNGDGIPDDIQIFEQTANTSCCRINPTSSRNTPKKKRKSTSRSRG